MNYRMFSEENDVKVFVKEGLKLVVENFNAMKENRNYVKYDIVKVGRLLKGEAYYHEVDEYYPCVGFELEVESQFDLDGKLTDIEREVGFFAVWKGESHEMAPFTFEEGTKEVGKGFSFSNGYGDTFEVTEEFKSVEEVEKIYKEL